MSAPTDETTSLRQRPAWWLNPIVHEAWGLIRERLRCPDCRAVGTWKPHGRRSDRRTGDRPVRRWLCKTCGLYQGPEGTLRCYPDPERKVWILPDPDHGPWPTPKEILNTAGLWPWAG